jgi:hypothetical protein
MDNVSKLNTFFLISEFYFTTIIIEPAMPLTVAVMVATPMPVAFTIPLSFT